MNTTSKFINNKNKKVFTHELNEDISFKSVISRLAEGNVSLFFGEYITQNEIDEVREDVLSFDYSKYLKN